jgi:hypothetical protein
MERQDPTNPIALGVFGLADEEKQYEEYVAKFGQEMADMLIEEMRKWAAHYTRAAFIDTGLGDSARFDQAAKDKAAHEGWIYERKQGDNRLLRMLINGEWNEDEFLVVAPGHRIEQSYDDALLRAVPV